MKLFALPDGTIDRKDRAQWLTAPFDLAFVESDEEQITGGRRVRQRRTAQGRTAHINDAQPRLEVNGVARIRN